MILDNLMYTLGMIAQSVVNEMDLPDERVKAAVYIKVITNLVNNVSEMMKRLNRFGVEEIRRKSSLKEELPDNKGIIV